RSPRGRGRRARCRRRWTSSRRAGAGSAAPRWLWHWHEDGEHYDQEHFQLLPHGEGWEVRVRRAVSRALSRQQLVDAASAAGFTGLHWHTPDATGFYQPVLTGRAAG
ncbi:hypothetical protein ACWCWE_39815, partial [Streptomyces sp. NPDC001759]